MMLLANEFLFKGPSIPGDVATHKAMVDHPNGGFIVLAGSSFYHLPHARPDAAWILLPQKLKTPRTWTTMFFVPDEIVTCK